MTCRQAKRRIPLLAGGDLSPRRSRAVQRHLVSCPDCRKELEATAAALEEARALARREPGLDWSEPEWRTILARIVSEGTPKRRAGVRRRLKPALAVSLASAVVLAGITVVLRHSIFRPGESRPGPAIETAQVRWPGSPVPGVEPEPASRTPKSIPAGQDVVSVTLVSEETGLQVVWFFDRNFEWKGDDK
jgi:anti-sigma factor RsiW